MNFYLQLLSELNAKQRAAAAAAASAGGVAAPPHAHFFSSFFWARLACSAAGYDYSAVARWTKHIVRPSHVLFACLFVLISSFPFH